MLNIRSKDQSHIIIYFCLKRKGRTKTSMLAFKTYFGLWGFRTSWCSRRLQTKLFLLARLTFSRYVSKCIHRIDRQLQIFILYRVTYINIDLYDVFLVFGNFRIYFLDKCCQRNLLVSLRHLVPHLFF